MGKNDLLILAGLAVAGLGIYAYMRQNKGIDAGTVAGVTTPEGEYGLTSTGNAGVDKNLLRNTRNITNTETRWNVIKEIFVKDDKENTDGAKKDPFSYKANVPLTYTQKNFLRDAPILQKSYNPPTEQAKKVSSIQKAGEKLDKFVRGISFISPINTLSYKISDSLRKKIYN